MSEFILVKKLSQNSSDALIFNKNRQNPLSALEAMLRVRQTALTDVAASDIKRTVAFALPKANSLRLRFTLGTPGKLLLKPACKQAHRQLLLPISQL